MIFWILGYAAIGAVLFFWLLPQKRRDWWKSDLQRLHLPPEEKNKLSNGKDGYFSRSHAYRNFAIMVGGLVGGGTVFQFYWAYALLAVAGILAIYGLLVKSNNRQDIETLEKNFDGQESILDNLRAVPESTWIGKIDLKGYGKQSAWVADTFYDFAIFVPSRLGTIHWKPGEREAEMQAAKDEMLPRIAKLAREADPDDWFDADRAKRVR
jgi:hypothetical protein